MSDEKKQDTFSGKMEPNKAQKVSKKSDDVQIMFRESRKFDLHVGRDVLVFKGRETKKVPKSWIAHKDFKQVQNLFVVKGV